MKFPCLVLERLCKTPIDVFLYDEGITEDGEPITYDGSFKCNYQDSAKTILTDEKKLVQITGRAFFVGDIFPDVPTLSGGEVVIFGEKRMIESGMKARNPDGTVNYTRLDLR